MRGGNVQGGRKQLFLQLGLEKNNFSDMKFFMIKYKGILDWQGRIVTHP